VITGIFIAQKEPCPSGLKSLKLYQKKMVIMVYEQKGINWQFTAARGSNEVTKFEISMGMPKTVEITVIYDGFSL